MHFIVHPGGVMLSRHLDTPQA